METLSVNGSILNILHGVLNTIPFVLCFFRFNISYSMIMYISFMKKKSALYENLKGSENMT